VYQREPQLIAERVVRPDLSNWNLKIRAKPARRVNAASRHVEVKRRAESRERRPLRHRLEIVHRFSRFNLDNAEQLAPTLRRLQHEVGVPRRRTRSHRRCLRIARVDGDVELSLIFRLQQANDPIVLELLADGPHEDGAQRNLRNEGKSR
jgi:hypothetical protein